MDKTADLSVYETNMNILYKELTELGFTCVKPGGTFYIFPKALEEDAKVFSQKALKRRCVQSARIFPHGLLCGHRKSGEISGSVAEVCEDGVCNYLESRSISKANCACTDEPFDMLM